MGAGRLVFGTSVLGGVWGLVAEQESIDCVLYALENGVSSFGTSWKNLFIISKY